MRAWILRGALLAGLGTAPALGAQPSAPADVPRIAPDEVLVLGRPAAPGRPGLSPAASPRALIDRARGRGVSAAEARPLFQNRNAGAAFPGGAWLLRLDPGTDPEAAAARLAQDPAIAYAGPNHVWRLDAAGAVSTLPRGNPLAVTPDDSLFSQQYGLTQSRVTEAWERTRGEGIVIGILDTGVDLTHPDLQGQFAINAAEAAGLPGVDDDGNGFVDDVSGYDFTDAPGMPGTGDYLGRDPDPQDEFGHGTEVAGVAAAAFQNGIGVAGVAPGARILPLRAAFSTRIPGVPALLQEDDIAAGILYAADQGAAIINMSFGDVVAAPVIAHACAYARSRGVLLVAGAGNTGHDEVFYPAAHPGVLSAGACAEDGNKTGFSTFGQDLDFLAAGVRVYTTRLGGGYRASSGTSFSAPFTSGVAALVWSAHPGWTADQVAWTLRLTAQDAAGGWTAGRGWGILDAAAAVAADTAPPVVQTEEAIPRDDGTLRIDATAAHPRLATWTLSAVPESTAVALGTPLPAGAVTLAAGSGQAVAESVAVFIPPAGAEGGLWVLNLDAFVPGYPAITKRQRVLVPPTTLHVEDLAVTRVVGDVGWDVIASWSSPEPYQGAAQAGGRFVSEISVGHHHGIHVPGPLIPADPTGVDILGRVSDQSPFQHLADTTWSVPPLEQRATAQIQGGLPPGTPMPRTVDWDGDGLPEVLVEAPPAGNTYGTVNWYELAAPDTPALLATSTYRGIPFDAADADGDGRAELLVYRVDGWSVWEAPAPGAFPDQPVALPPEATGVPLGFVDTGSGIRLIAVDDRTVRAFRLDPAAGFVLAGEDSAAMSLGRPHAAGDFDGDGRLDLAVSGLEQGIAVFQVTDQAVTAEPGLDVPYPEVVLKTRPVSGSADELLSVELDPGGLFYEGDLDRPLSRLRRWRYDGTALATISELAFAGLDLYGDVQLMDLGNDLVIRRRQRFDVVAVDTDAVTWGGILGRSSIPVTGSVLAGFPGGAQWIWAGSSNAAVPAGEGLTVVPDATLLGSSIQVYKAESVSGGVFVSFLIPDACNGAMMTRSGGVRGDYALGVTSGNAAADTLAIGETATYTVTNVDCPPRTLMLTGRAAPLPLTVSWEDSRTLIVDLPRPLRGSPGTPVPPQNIWILGKDSPLPITVSPVQIVHEGRRIWLRIPEEAQADSLRFWGAWYADGYPVGGAFSTEVPLPPRPAPVLDPVLAAVHYRSGDAAHLEVTLGGSGAPCPQGFVLDPTGTPLPIWTAASAGADYTLEIPLENILAPGSYTLRFADVCLAGRASPLGTERTFTVEAAGKPVIYPNPVPPGADLVVENLEPGSRVQVNDLRGDPRVTFTVDQAVFRRPVTDLAPGLYILRIEDPDGRLIAVQKLVIRR